MWEVTLLSAGQSVALPFQTCLQPDLMPLETALSLFACMGLAAPTVKLISIRLPLGHGAKSRLREAWSTILHWLPWLSGGSHVWQVAASPILSNGKRWQWLLPPSCPSLGGGSTAVSYHSLLLVLKHREKS